MGHTQTCTVSFFVLYNKNKNIRACVYLSVCVCVCACVYAVLHTVFLPGPGDRARQTCILFQCGCVQFFIPKTAKLFPPAFEILFWNACDYDKHHENIMSWDRMNEYCSYWSHNYARNCQTSTTNSSTHTQSDNRHVILQLDKCYFALHSSLCLIWLTRESTVLY